MPGSNGDSDQIPAKPEQPPVLKKSKITVPDDGRTPHFPGPLFPAVRRPSSNSSSTFPSSSSSSATAATVSTTTSSASTSRDAFSFNFSDRDYVFPSNLGPYSTRRSVTVKSSSSKSQNLASQLPMRSASMPSILSAGGNRASTVDSQCRTDVPKSKTKLKVDKDLKPLSIQSSALASSLTASSLSSRRNSANSYSSRKVSGVRISWILNLVSILFFFLCWFFIFFCFDDVLMIITLNFFPVP